MFDGAVEGINGLEIVLKPPLVFAVQTDEFDSHAHSRIAGAYQRAGRNPFRPHPQLRAQTGSDGKRRKHLDIATAAADIGRGDADRGSLVTQSNGEGNFVSGPSPAAWRSRGLLPIRLGKGSSPGAVLFAQKLYAHLNLVNRPAIPRPYHFASRFLLTNLHSDGVPDHKLMLDHGEKRAGGADILGASVLGKRMAIGSHAPHDDV